MQADKNFVHGPKKLHKTLLQHNKKLEGMDFVLLSNDIKEMPGFEVRRFNPNRYRKISFMKRKRTGNTRRFQKTFYKFEVFAIQGYDRMVFLDSDLLCLGDVSQLFNPGLTKFDLCAVPDTNGKARHHKDGYYRINSGMQVINKGMIGAGIRDELIEFAEAGKSWDGGDQGTLIEYLWAKKKSVKYLPLTYNTLKRMVVKNPTLWAKLKPDVRLLHFVGRVKPWTGHEKGYQAVEQIWRQA
jgi:lipopolysaccharide biosynthesis glycosyltransferase